MSSFASQYVQNYMNNMFNQNNADNQLFQQVFAEVLRSKPMALDVHRETCQKCKDASDESDLCFLGKKVSMLDNKAMGLPIK